MKCTFSCSDCMQTIYWLRWCTGILPILNFSDRGKVSIRGNSICMGNHLFPLLLWSLPRPPKVERSAWKQGNILVQGWRMLSSHRKSVWQAEKLNCPRLPCKCKEFGPHLDYLARLCLPCRNDPEVCNSRHLASCVLQREWFWTSLGHTCSFSQMPLGLWRSLRFVQLKNKLFEWNHFHAHVGNICQPNKDLYLK